MSRDVLMNSRDVLRMSCKALMMSHGITFPALSDFRCMFVNQSERYNWSEASNFCQQNSATLLKVDSEILAQHFASTQG